jgi:hypothetical protein
MSRCTAVAAIRRSASGIIAPFLRAYAPIKPAKVETDVVSSADKQFGRGHRAHQGLTRVDLVSNESRQGFQSRSTFTPN